jgi:hypothetical protein
LVFSVIVTGAIEGGFTVLIYADNNTIISII